MRRVSITGIEGRSYRTVAAVQDDSKWRLFRPFGEDAIREAALVGDDFLVCLSENAELCSTAWRSGEETARRRIESYRCGKLRATADAQHIVIYRGNSIQVVRATSLETVAEGETLQWARGDQVGRIVNLGRYPSKRSGPYDPVQLRMLGDITEDRAGRLVFMVYDCGPAERSRYGVCRVDRADWTVHFDDISATTGPWTWFSPSGRYAIARHVRTLAYDDGSPRSSFWPLTGRQPRHRDASPDGVKRFGGSLEIWETDPPSLKRIVVAQMAPLTLPKDDPRRPFWHNVVDKETDDWIALAKSSATRPIPNLAPEWRPSDADVKAHPERQLWRRLPYAAGTVVWEPDESSFWIQYDYYGNHRIRFRRIGVDGSISPSFGFQRFTDKGGYARLQIGDLADPSRVAIEVNQGVFGQGVIYIQCRWCDSELPFKLISESEDGFEQTESPWPSELAIRRFLGPPGRHVVPVDAFAEVSVIDALQRLTRDIRERLADFVKKDRLELSFKIGERHVTEASFFKQLARQRMAIVPALRDLLTTYLTVQPQVLAAKGLYQQIWGPKNMGAFGPAMEALLLLDSSAHDVFRAYLSKRDGEHETHSTNVIMKAYIHHTGWKDIAMIRFRIYFALIRQRDGYMAISGGLLNEYGLVDAAEKMIDAEEFAALIVDEIDNFILNFDLDEENASALHQALLPSLEIGQYGELVLGAIASRVGLRYTPASAEDRGWSREFLRFYKQNISGREQQ